MPETVDLWVALSLPYIEEKPKDVILDRNFVIKKELNDTELQDLATIKECIESGKPLDDYYRGSTRYDELLARQKVLHLHLGGKRSDSLLYLIQYPECVLFLCVDTHVHLEDVPVGKRFMQLGRKAVEKQLKSDAGSKS